MYFNRIFDSEGNGWEGFPRKSYARLDQVEPADLKKAHEAVFAFDAIDASWSEFDRGSAFDLNSPGAIASNISDIWKRLFGSQSQRPRDIPFDRMPVYRIEVTAQRGDLFWDQLSLSNEHEWYVIELKDAGSVAADVYGAILADGVPAYLSSFSVLSGTTALSLSAIFNVDFWPDASDQDLQDALAKISQVTTLVVYDIGQGSAVGILDSNNSAKAYFDLGAGSYGNKHTRPKPLRFCWTADPPVILSHWDTDHWAGEQNDPDARQRTWVAPRQTNLPPTHHLFASKILKAGGTLLIWNAAAGSTLQTSLGSGQTLTIGRCHGSTRNGSGIACVVENSTDQCAWLLTGDAGYSELGVASGYDPISIVVPHHGSDMTHLGSPPKKLPTSYGRLLYSFGQGNKHGRTRVSHPTSNAVNDHNSKNWNHGAWLSNGIGTCVAGSDVLATAENPVAGGAPGRHLDGAAAGWVTSPVVPLSGLPHGKAKSAGCTTDIQQS